MSIELRLNEKFDALVDEFENRMVDAKNIALEAQQLFFRVVEELEDKFSNGVRGVCSDMIDRYVREELAEDFLSEEAMALVSIVKQVAHPHSVPSLFDMHCAVLGLISLHVRTDLKGTKPKQFSSMLLCYYLPFLLSILFYCISGE